MQEFLATEGVWHLVLAALVVMVGGFAKGAVGFALPLIAVSGMASFLPAPTVLAGLVLPILVSNIWQSLRQGFGEAWATLRLYAVLNIAITVTLIAVAQVTAGLPDWALYAILGTVITGFSLVQMLGWQPPDPGPHRGWEAVAGTTAGVFGALAAIWGPPVAIYLLARRLPKTEMIRVQGLSFLTGSVALLLAHLQSGIFNARTAELSAVLVIPTLIGMGFGLRMQDRMPQATFRRWTLIVLALSGLNLLRRALAS